MGARGSGRKPRPNHLKALEGARESRINRDEPIPAEGAIVPPTELEPAAQAVWDRLAPDLIAKRVLQTWDTDSFSAYCRAVALFDRTAAEVAAHGELMPSPAFRSMVNAQKMMTQLGSRFGLSPADRASIKIDPRGPKTGDEGYVI